VRTRQQQDFLRKKEKGRVICSPDEERGGKEGGERAQDARSWPTVKRGKKRKSLKGKKVVSAFWVTKKRKEKPAFCLFASAVIRKKGKKGSPMIPQGKGVVSTAGIAKGKDD